MSRRVVITGLGTVTGFGYGVDALWDGLVDGRSTIGPIARFDPTGLRSRVASEVKDFSARDHVPKSYRKAVKVMARDIELAVGAAKAAVEHAGIVTKGVGAEEGATPTYAPARVGCQIGAGLIAAELPELAMALSSAADDKGDFSFEKWGAGAINDLTPLWLLKYLPNMLACHVTIIHDAQGPSNTITCSEASAGLSIGESMRVIQRNDADLCFTGGAESKVGEVGMLRADFAGRVAHLDEKESAEAWKHVRPFDPTTKGGVVGEAGGILLIEALDTAKKRGAKPVAELIGFGAGHSPRSESASARAEGLEAAIENALENAGVTAADIDAIVPHGAGVRSVDDEEAHALRKVLGARLAQLPLVTLTPNIGDSFASAGGVAACVGAVCLQRQMLPARIHGGTPAQGLNAGASSARDARLGHVLVCTNSLGGQNAALVLRAWRGE